MKKFTDKTYPFGLTKYELFDRFLDYYDFGIDVEEYGIEKAQILLSDKRNETLVSWYEDVDGKLIVDGLTLKDPFLRIEITRKGFVKQSIASWRAEVARHNHVETGEDLVKLFTPYSAVPNPLRFVGREVEVSRVINEIPVHGKLFAISGERSLGKTSFIILLQHLFEKNKDIEKYYAVKHNSALDTGFRIIKIDAQVGPNDIESLSEYLKQELKEDSADKTEISDKITMKTPIVNVERWEKRVFIKKDYGKQISELIEKLKIQKNKRVVLLMDELDQFRRADRLASIIRNLSTFGALICVAGSSKAVDRLLSGHVSLVRDTVLVSLKPLTEIEFREIYFLVNLMAGDILKFDYDSVSIMWKYSGGLPFFAQLFGHLCLSRLVDEYGNAERLLKDRLVKGPLTITEDEINKVIRELPIKCNLMEECAQKIFNLLNENSKALEKLGKKGKLSFSELEKMGWSNQMLKTIETGRERDPLVKKLLQVENEEMQISDPTIRQYINISR